MTVTPGPRCEPDEVVFAVTCRHETTVRQLGIQLAEDSSDKQAGILLAMANDITGWENAQFVWQRQCLFVADHFSSDTELERVEQVLSDLVWAIQERRKTLQESTQEPADAGMTNVRITS